MNHRLRCVAATSVCAALIFLPICFQNTATAQNCRQSLNVNPDKVIVLEAWNDAATTTVMTCGEAEQLRGDIFRDQLAFLTEAQSITAARVSRDIETALSQLRQLRQDLAAVRNAENARTLSATVQSMKFLASKAKLLICALVTIDSGGILGLVACGKPLISFLQQSKRAFDTFSSAAEAQDRATHLQQLINEMEREFQALNVSRINGSATTQQYAVVFESLCRQVRASCLR